MPPRIRVGIPHQISAQTIRGPRCRNGLILSCRYASAAATTPAATPEQMTSSNSPVQQYPPSQSPSHRRPEFRKSQLHRQYTSLLRTTPLMLLFQHNNLQSTEWAGIRRELSRALQKVDENHAAAGRTEPPLASSIKIQIIQTGIFEAALRVVEFFQPNDALATRTAHATDPSTSTSAEIPNVRGTPAELAFTHDLSRAAHDATLKMKGKHDLSTLLMGPIAVLTFPQVSPEHLKAALSILSPKAPMFPAPPRKLNPGYYNLTVQSGLQKLMLLAARVEGKVFDLDETRWVGGIEGGMGGLRSQLVYALQGMGAGVTGALEGASKSLYLTMESRRSVLEEEQKGGEEKKSDS